MLGGDVKIQRINIDRKRLELAMAELSRGRVKVGFPSGGARTPDSKITVAEKAIFNEYGSNNGRIPPRPFMRQTVELTKDELETLKAGLLLRIYRKQMDSRSVFGVLGEWYSARIRRTITTDGTFKPNAVSTIKAKGSSKPLINMGQMKNAVTYKVEGV